MGNNTVRASKVYEIGNQLDLFNFENITGLTGSDDVSDIALSSNHKTGKSSVSFDKDGTTETTGIISKTLKETGKNANIFAIHKLMLKVYLSSTTNLTSISITIGEDASNNNVYTQSTLTSGWNELTFNCNSPSSVNGDGIDWYSIKYLAITATFAGAGNTLTGILVDTSYLFKSSNSGSPSSDVNIDKVNGNTPNFSQETGGNLDTIAAKVEDNRLLLSTIDADTSALATALTPYFDEDGDNVRAVLSASPGKLSSISASNSNAVDCWVQLFDLAVGDVTVGTTTPTYVLFVPKGDGTNSGAVTKDFQKLGLNFAVAITYACTTTPEGAGDPTVGLVINAGYSA